jgi:hypothetical protein
MQLIEITWPKLIGIEMFQDNGWDIIWISWEKYNFKIKNVKEEDNLLGCWAM